MSISREPLHHENEALRSNRTNRRFICIQSTPHAFSASVPFPVENRSFRSLLLSRFFRFLLVRSFLYSAINFSSFVAPWRRGPSPRPRYPWSPETDGRRSGCLPRFINSTTRNKGLRHNKTQCLRIVRFTSRHQESSGRETLVTLCKI